MDSGGFQKEAIKDGANANGSIPLGPKTGTIPLGYPSLSQRKFGFKKTQIW